MNPNKKRVQKLINYTHLLHKLKVINEHDKDEILGKINSNKHQKT